MQDHLELQELADIALTALRQVGDLNRVLYVAHVNYGKKVDDLAKQLNRDPSDIAHRIDFVVRRIRKEMDRRRG